MASVLVLCCSRTGNTEAMSRSVAEGAKKKRCAELGERVASLALKLA